MKIGTGHVGGIGGARNKRQRPLSNWLGSGSQGSPLGGRSRACLGACCRGPARGLGGTLAWRGEVPVRTRPFSRSAGVQHRARPGAAAASSAAAGTDNVAGTAAAAAVAENRKIGGGAAAVDAVQKTRGAAADYYDYSYYSSDFYHDPPPAPLTEPRANHERAQYYHI
eukprot:CAMPEP_0179993328 /NCGR_PEP_ID=MMETSP0984-20121128/5979_1 /TAXON_ID=483367 /ORGANISM="non described non described, Strain CCMP 2436" /LENGTH=167 /DNA_ID=CAMNT_0021912717 /DNA_START=1224 /DNA_END=1728 /DNA_ORIENTATION=-